MPPTTRRQALILIASASQARAQHHHDSSPPPPATAYKPKTLTPAQMDLVGKLSDLIIPRTDTPGASDAGVPEFIDRRLTASPDLAAAFRKGLPQFAPLPTDRQLALLTDLSNQPGDEFFRLLKDLTIDGYYSSRAGLVEELGWHGNTFLTEFKGCTHPEHQS